MDRRKLIEWYAKSAGIIVFINTFFVLVMSAIAVYISEEAELAGADANFEFYSMQLTFLFGMFLTLFHIIIGLIGFIKKAVGSLRAAKVISILSGFTAILFGAACESMLVTKSAARKDLYTLTVILIGLAGAAICFVYSVLAIICSVMASRYGYDTVKINTKLNKITEGRVESMYCALMMFTYTLFTLSSGFMSLFMSYQLKTYAKDADISTPLQSILLMGIFIAMVIVSINMFAAVIGTIIGKSPADRVKLIMILAGLAVMAVYNIITLTLIGKSYTTAGYTDVTYIIFNYVLIIISVFPAITCIRAWKPSPKRR